MLSNFWEKSQNKYFVLSRYCKGMRGIYGEHFFSDHEVIDDDVNDNDVNDNDVNDHDGNW